MTISCYATFASALNGFVHRRNEGLGAPSSEKRLASYIFSMEITFQTFSGSEAIKNMGFFLFSRENLV